MSTQQNAMASAATPSGKILWRLFTVILGLAILAVGGTVVWWLNRPVLEPLPNVASERLDPEVRRLLEESARYVAFSSRSSQAWGNLGAAYFVHSFEPEAQVCFRNAERLEPRNYRWPYLLGLSLVYTDEEQMLAAYRRAAKWCGERTHVQLRLAEALLDRGEFAEAAVQIKNVMSHASANPRAQYAQARLLLAEGKTDEAKTWAERSVANAADKRAPHLLMAQLCRRTNDATGEAKALAALEQIPDGFTPWEDPDVMAMGPLSRDRASQLARAEDLAKGRDAAKGKEILYDMAKENDGSSAATALAQSHIREGKFRQAESFLRQQLRGSPDDERLHFQLGTACFQQDKYAEAEAALRRTLQLKPDYSDALYLLGLTLRKLDHPGDAHVAFAEVVRISPGQANARINLAELLLAEGKLAEAEEHLQVALKVAPEESRARELLAIAKAGRK